MRRAVVLACVLSSQVAVAQPEQPGADKTDAKALLQSGLKLFTAKDYLGALAVFRDAYARFPSAKILLNIATTLSRLDRKADAANAYQRYLDAADHDPAKSPEVAKVLAELDRAIGTLELAITPADAEVRIGDGEWVPGATARLYRVTKGEVVVRARRDSFTPGERAVRVGAGEKLAVELALVAIPVTPVPGGDGGETTDPTSITKPAEPAAPRARFGAFALALVDIPNRGAAARIGLTADLTGRLQAQAAALLGATPGGYLGVSFAFLDGDLRPLVSAGLPIFVSDGPRVGVRGAAGIEYVLGRHLSLIAEVGVEHVVNPEMNVVATTFIPAIGAAGRL